MSSTVVPRLVYTRHSPQQFKNVIFFFCRHALQINCTYLIEYTFWKLLLFPIDNYNYSDLRDDCLHPSSNTLLGGGYSKFGVPHHCRHIQTLVIIKYTKISRGIPIWAAVGVQIKNSRKYGFCRVQSSCQLQYTRTIWNVIELYRKALMFERTCAKLMSSTIIILARRGTENISVAIYVSNFLYLVIF